ncbi:MAG: heavy-metal-associated domain-containing protein [Planctomycetota bacterium]
MSPYKVTETNKETGMSLRSYILAFSLVGAAVAPAALAPSVSVAQDAPDYAIGIDGMVDAGACPRKIKRALRKIDGVKKVTVDYEKKSATLKVADGVKLTKDQVNEALAAFGYSVSTFTDNTGG